MLERRGRLLAAQPRERLDGRDPDLAARGVHARDDLFVRFLDPELTERLAGVISNPRVFIGEAGAERADDHGRGLGLAERAHHRAARARGRVRGRVEQRGGPFRVVDQRQAVNRSFAELFVVVRERGDEHLEAFRIAEVRDDPERGAARALIFRARLREREPLRLAAPERLNRGCSRLRDARIRVADDREERVDRARVARARERVARADAGIWRHRRGGRR